MLLMLCLACRPDSTPAEGPVPTAVATPGLPADTGAPATTDTGSPPWPVVPCGLSDAELRDGFDTWVAQVQAVLDAQGIAGASVAVSCGETVLATGLGAQFAGGPATTADTRFQAASITKNLTAAAALATSDAGGLDLHAPVSDAVPYVNDIAPDGTAITVHDLMTHSAGYPTYFDGLSSSFDLDAYFETLGAGPLWAPPGAVFVYSNLGADLAGLAVQEATGLPFADVVTSEVLVPAGMTRATLDPDAVIADGDYASGLSASGLTGPLWGYFPTGYYGPMGGAWLTAADLVTWGQVQLRSDGTVLSTDAMDALHTPWMPTRQLPDQHHGYHLFIDSWDGTEIWQHGGAAPGFQSTFGIVPAHGLSVAALVNTDTYYAPWLLEAALGTFLDLVPPDAGATVRPTSEWGVYAGTYDDPVVLGSVEVTLTGTQLTATVPGLGCGGELLPLSEDNFLLICDGVYVPWTFWVNEAGDAAAHLASVYGIAARSDP